MYSVCRKDRYKSLPVRRSDDGCKCKPELPFIFTTSMERKSKVPKLLVFGPQILSFDQIIASRLEASLNLSQSFDWVHEVLDDLSNLWPSLEDVLPNLQIGRASCRERV